MEKKIIIALASSVLMVYSCNSKSINDDKAMSGIAKHDTVYFGSEKSLRNYREKFLINGATELNNGVAIKTNGVGINVWIDSLLYFSKHENKLVAVASTLDHGFSLIYYNGDSLSIEKIAINKPAVEDCKTNNFRVVSITDSSFNSGYLIKSMLFFKLNNNGTLEERKEYFPKKKENEKYDFIIRTECYKDSVIIFRNDKAEYTFK